MSLRRKGINIVLIILACLLGGLAVWLNMLPPLVLSPEEERVTGNHLLDTSRITTTEVNQIPVPSVQASDTTEEKRAVARAAMMPKVAVTSFKDVDTRSISVGHPFRQEALKVLSGRLEETDSINRRMILSYCEHLRTSYTTRDIDFIRQVFSDDALIITGQVVKTGARKAGSAGYSEKIKYSIRSKQAYIERLIGIFERAKNLDVKFSNFKIMRHPTVEGIYGVTLRQKYTNDSYSDDGYLFLLWDFRNPSMPLIHVRTWQPAQSLAEGEEIIDISDFNLE